MYLDKIKTITIFLIYYEYEKSENWNLVDSNFFEKFQNLLIIFFNTSGE